MFVNGKPGEGRWRMMLLLGIIAMSCFSCGHQPEPAEEVADYNWGSYLGGLDRNHYAPLDQINRENVNELQVAWHYRSENGDSSLMGQIQNNPLIIDGVLYGTSPTLKVFALEADTGKEIWKFDHRSANINYGMNVNRGLVYYRDGEDQRIYFTAGPFLYAINATNGKLIENFGQQGKISLQTGLSEEEEEFYVVSTSPGVIYGENLILGFRTLESMGAAPGYIRAFNLHSGELAWTFHTVPKPGEYGFHTWPKGAHEFMGGANSWAGVSLDSARGIVYIPTGSAAFDFYGGNRQGANLFANSILALDAGTGNRIWHFQVVHHDIWDRDLPAPPNLVTLNHRGRKVDALAQITKHGYVYMFNRVTGEPIFDIEERPVPTDTDLEGEEAWPTQPFPVKPPPFARQDFTEDQLSDFDPVNRDSLAAILRKARKGQQFIPPSKKGTLIFPGFDGGGEWGGAAVDPRTNIMYVNNSEMPWILTMVETGMGKIGKRKAELTEGERVYQLNCALCHGPKMEGDPTGTYPGLTDLGQRLKKEDVLAILSQGRNLMPAFAHISGKEREAVTNFILGTELQGDVHDLGSENNRNELPFSHTGYRRFVDSNGNPAIKPPWGQLNAIDLEKGEILWQVTLGEFDELTAQGIPKTGTENYGGPVVTSGNLIFIAATKDEYIRAFDQETGEELWKYKLPAAAYATPSTYMIDGKQYLVIACGGGKIGSKPGDSIVAFALP